MSEPIDPEAFRDFEYAGWQKVARGYRDNFAKLTTQVIGPLLDAVNVVEDKRVLDIHGGRLCSGGRRRTRSYGNRCRFLRHPSGNGTRAIPGNRVSKR